MNNETSSSWLTLKQPDDSGRSRWKRLHEILMSSCWFGVHFRYGFVTQYSSEQSTVLESHFNFISNGSFTSYFSSFDAKNNSFPSTIIISDKMKALFWQWTLITTLCLAAQCIASPFDNSKYLQVSGLRPMNLYTRKVNCSRGNLIAILDWN